MTNPGLQQGTNGLPSWSNTPTKQAILDFVAAVTHQNGPDYVPPAERIAAFDNDGTLWCEYPMPPQVMAILDGLAMAVAQNPALGEQPLYRAAVDKDMAWFAPYMSNKRIPELLAMLLEAGAGETQAEFEARAEAWLAKALQTHQYPTACRAPPHSGGWQQQRRCSHDGICCCQRQTLSQPARSAR